MKKSDLIFIILGIVLGAFCYLSTNSIFYSVVIVVIFILDYFVLMKKKITKFYSLIERVHTSYHFINSFVITLSVKDSFEEAYQNGIRINNARLNAETEQLTEMTPIERVKYLKDYFNLSIYLMFLNVLDLYQDQGGNILLMSENLIKECTKTEKTLSDTLAIGNKHLKEFITLWIMSIGILIFMRFSLKDFYGLMLKNTLFVLLLFVFFVLIIASINIFVLSYTKLSVKEVSK